MDPHFTFVQNYMPLVILGIVALMVAIPTVLCGNYSQRTTRGLAVVVFAGTAILCIANGSWGGLAGLAAVLIGFFISRRRAAKR